ncbi:uncharacterized protein RB166_011335 [Leptodactylus fuscus]|uniref:uncharacterized protein LOC142209426 n=1 Tax=Leptodactylus fuscus TaxID=238119 RepID=UPI003F4EB926
MPRSKEISEELRKKVVEAHEAGRGYKTISKVFDLHRSTVRQIIYKWKVFNTIATRPRSGRPTKLTTILRTVRPSRAGNQNGAITTEESDDEREESLQISDNENETTQDDSGGGGSVYRTMTLSERIGKEVNGSAQGEMQNTRVLGTDTHPESSNPPGHTGEDRVRSSVNPLQPSDPGITSTAPTRIRGHQVKTKGLEMVPNRALASHVLHSCSQAPTLGPAEQHMDLMLCCEICGACFPTETDLERHQAQHLDKMLHECEDCGKVFKSAAGLKTHWKRKHGC